MKATLLQIASLLHGWLGFVVGLLTGVVVLAVGTAVGYNNLIHRLDLLERSSEEIQHALGEDLDADHGLRLQILEQRALAFNEVFFQDWGRMKQSWENNREQMNRVQALAHDHEPGFNWWEGRP